MQIQDTSLFFQKKKKLFVGKKINMNRHVLIFKYIIYNLRGISKSHPSVITSLPEITPKIIFLPKSHPESPKITLSHFCQNHTQNHTKNQTFREIPP